MNSVPLRSAAARTSSLPRNHVCDQAACSVGAPLVGALPCSVAGRQRTGPLAPAEQTALRLAPGPALPGSRAASAHPPPPCAPSPLAAPAHSSNLGTRHAHPPSPALSPRRTRSASLPGPAPPYAPAPPLRSLTRQHLQTMSPQRRQPPRIANLSSNSYLLHLLLTSQVPFLHLSRCHSCTCQQVPLLHQYGCRSCTCRAPQG